MKLLLDENLPKRLKKDFPSHITYTFFEMGWAGFQNGKLLALMIEEGFDALLTFDKNLQHQQNFSKYSVTAIVISAPNNTYETLTKLSSRINELLDSKNLLPGAVVIKQTGDFSE